MVSIHHGAATQRARLPNWWVNRAQSTSRSRAGGDGHLQARGHVVRSKKISIRREHQAKPAGSSRLPAPPRAPARPARKERWPKESTPFSRIASTRATITRSGFRPAFPPSLRSLSLSSTCALVCGLNPVGRIMPHYLVVTWGDCPPLPRNSINKSVMLFASSEIKARGDTEAIELCMLRVTDSEIRG